MKTTQQELVLLRKLAAAVRGNDQEMYSLAEEHLVESWGEEVEILTDNSAASFTETYLKLPDSEGWWWEWMGECWQMQYVWKELSSKTLGYTRCGRFLEATVGRWIKVPVPPKESP